MAVLLSHPDRTLEEHLKEVQEWGNFYRRSIAVLKDVDDDIFDSYPICFMTWEKEPLIFRDTSARKPWKSS
jgi:hypothetical protein